MKTFQSWLENNQNPQSIEVGDYKVEITNAGAGKLLVTVFNKKDTYSIDSKGMVKKIIDVSSLKTSPFLTDKTRLIEPQIKEPMMNRMEPVDNRGAGGLTSP